MSRTLDFLPTLQAEGVTWDSPQFDTLVVVNCDATKVAEVTRQLKTIDAGIDDEVSVVYDANLPHHSLIYSPTGKMTRDQDDIRTIYNAALKGMKRAVKCGAKKPNIFFEMPDSQFGPTSSLVCILGAYEALYVPLEIREACPDKKMKAETLGSAYAAKFHSNADMVPKFAAPLEAGRAVARDIGGSDPERMAAPRVADYVSALFKGTCVKVEIEKSMDVFEKEYPCFAAVNRAAQSIERHQARLIFLTYEGEGPIDQTLFVVGKGVTYDTGGLDIKAGGNMAGMHRDKCGSAAVAGFFKVLADLKPKGLKVCGVMTMVRNSVGPDGYVADEIITARSGKRVRVGNTDAEGRMAMADLLCLFKEKALSAVNPHLFTIATLTGHAVRTYGEGYSVAMDNGPARKERTAECIRCCAEKLGDMFEVSTVRAEDYKAHAGRNEYEDILQCQTGPSTGVSRGHQGPAAFLTLTSGLEKHGNGCEQQLKYTHIDIAASSGSYPGIPTGAPILGLCAKYVLPRCGANLHEK